MSYEETIKDIEKTFGTVPGFMKETPKDILSQVWPLFRKYQLGESVIPQKYREMMMLAAAAPRSVLTAKHIIKRFQKCGVQLMMN